MQGMDLRVFGEYWQLNDEIFDLSKAKNRRQDKGVIPMGNFATL
jgi:hypothetical protein